MKILIVLILILTTETQIKVITMIIVEEILIKNLEVQDIEGFQEMEINGK